MDLAEFKDDKLEYIEDDIKKIQQKSGMYISYTGARGALHCAREIIQNGIDESLNKNSPCDEIIVEHDELSDRLTVEDNGRGIPENDYPLDIVCTKLQSGSKFTREAGGASSGENGVGLTACNALASYFSLSSIRSGMNHTIEFEEGIKTNDSKTKGKKKHGVIVKFSPSKKYLGKSAKIPRPELKKWIENISFFIPERCKIHLFFTHGMEAQEDFTYKARPLVELLENSIGQEDKLTAPVSLKDSTVLEEEARGVNDKVKNVKRNLTIQFSFIYTATLEPYIDSYCNFINTISGGVHLEAVKEALWRFFVKKTTETLTDKEKEKYKILKVDAMQGLNLVVNLSTDMQMQLVGQTKNAVGNDDLFDPIKKLVTKQLEEYFSENKEKLSQITKLIKASCRARLEASRVRTVSIKEDKDKFSKWKDDKFVPCNNEGKQYKEIYICEGESAGGCLVDARDPDTQAIFKLRGVTANAFKRDEVGILDNIEWSKLVEKLKMGYGPTFNINKAYYNKIIIATDSDVDGYNIRTGVCGFFVLRMPEVIRAGMLYVALAPLYNISDKKTPYVRSKHEYVEVYQDKIVSNFKVILAGESSPMKTNEFRQFILETQEYQSELKRISEHFGKTINHLLVEFIAAYFVLNGLTKIDPYKTFDDNEFVLDFKTALQSRFPEMNIYPHCVLKGIIDGRHQSLRINYRTLKKLEDLFPIYSRWGYELNVKEKGASDYHPMTIKQFLDSTNKFIPKIISRYKGLGEADSKELWETTMNPDTRILIQLTMDDYDDTLRRFTDLQSQSDSARKMRKDMLSNYKIRRDDLDN